MKITEAIAKLGRKPRLVVVIGRGGELPDSSTGTTYVRAASLSTVKLPDSLLRADVVLLMAPLASASRASAQHLSELTHEAGMVVSLVPQPALANLLPAAGFTAAPKGALRWIKTPQASPAEYDDSYIERWGDNDWLANSHNAAEEILAHLPAHLDRKTARVIDVGCLNGYIMESLRQAGVEHIYGTDISYSLAISHIINRDLLPAIKIEDFTDNSYPDASFDVTICMEVLEHIPPVASDPFIAQLARITKRDGILLISTSEDPDADPTHINCRQRAEWYYLFSRHGLVPTGSQEIFPGFNSFVVRHAKNKPELRRVHRLNTLRYKARKLTNAQEVKRLTRQTVTAVQDKLPGALQPHYGTVSYAQQGEDVMVRHLFRALGITRPSYLDIGAHHPYYLSNTALFYKSGSRGVNVEPDPDLFQRFQKLRPKDTNLNIGVAAKAAKLDFYMMNPSSINTFSADEVKKYTDRGLFVRAVKKIKVDTVQSILNQYCGGVFPDFLSLDVEGLDLEILQSINFKKTAPIVICVETATYEGDGYGKVSEVADFLLAQGYKVYGDTFTNTIFVRADRW